MNDQDNLLRIYINLFRFKTYVKMACYSRIWGYFFRQLGLWLSLIPLKGKAGGEQDYNLMGHISSMLEQMLNDI